MFGSIFIRNVLVFIGGDPVTSPHDGGPGHGPPDENEEVMRALLIHEKRSVVGTGGVVGAVNSSARGLTSTTANASDSDSDTSESDEDIPSAPPTHTPATYQGAEEEEDDDEEFEEVGDEPMVTVGGQQFSYREVSQKPELVKQMSAQEKDAYIEMSQNLFQDMYF